MAASHFLLPVSLVFEGDGDGTAGRRNPRLLLDLVKHAQLDGRLERDVAKVPAGRPVIVVLNPASKTAAATVKVAVSRVGSGLVQCVACALEKDAALASLPSSMAGAPVLKLHLVDGGAKLIDADIALLQALKLTLCKALPEDHPHRRLMAPPRDSTTNPFARTASGSATDDANSPERRRFHHHAPGSGTTSPPNASLHSSTKEPLAAAPSLNLGESRLSAHGSMRTSHSGDGAPSALGESESTGGNGSSSYARMVERRRMRRDVRRSTTNSACNDGSDLDDAGMSTSPMARSTAAASRSGSKSATREGGLDEAAVPAVDSTVPSPSDPVAAGSPASPPLVESTPAPASRQLTPPVEEAPTPSAPADPIPAPADPIPVAVPSPVLQPVATAVAVPSSDVAKPDSSDEKKKRPVRPLSDDDIGASPPQNADGATAPPTPAPRPPPQFPAPEPNEAGPLASVPPVVLQGVSEEEKTAPGASTTGVAFVAGVTEQPDDGTTVALTNPVREPGVEEPGVFGVDDTDGVDAEGKPKGCMRCSVM